MADNSSTKALNIDVNATITNESLTSFEKLKALQKALVELQQEETELEKSKAEFAKEGLEQTRKKIDELKQAIKLEPKKEKGKPSEFFAGLFQKPEKKDSEELGKMTRGMIKQGFKQGASILQSTFNIAWDSFANLMKDVLDEMETIMQSSLLTSSKTRGNAFKYGMSGAESYGFETAKDLLDISDEDLMYMNPQQSELFRKAMKKYADKYTQLYESGFYQQMLEFQVERQAFQKDIELEFIRILMENKETIMSAMRGILVIMEKIIQIAGLIGGRNTATASEVVSNYSSKNIKVDTTFNMTGQMTRQDLINAGEMTAEAIVSQIEQFA